MTQQKYYLHILALPLLLTFSSNSPMLSSMLNPTIKKIAKRQENDEITRIKQLATITDVDHEIDILKNNVYEECLTELASITHQSRDDLRNKIDTKREFTKKDLRKISRSDKNHDENIPSPMYQQLTKAMSEMQINPNNIDLEYITTTNKPGLLADAKGGAYLYNKWCIKPKIRIYALLTKRSIETQNFTYHHELQHILLEHTFMDCLALLYNPSLETSAKRKEFISIQEREADIHAASANIHNARIGVNDSCIFGHVKIIKKEKHCEEMLLIYELMKQKEQLSKKASIC